MALGNVTSWTTSYPTGGSAITVTDAGAPYPQATNTPTGDVSNYNTTIHFSGNSMLNLQALQNTTSLNLLDNSTTGEEGTFFGNYYFPVYIDNNDHIMSYQESSGNDGIQFRNLGVNGRFAIGYGLGTTTNATRNWSENHLPTTISYRGNRSTSTSMEGYENSKLYTTSSASQSSGPTGLYFGVKTDESTSPYNGYLNEFIFFNKDLSNTEMLKVDSYLGVKYGITLDNTGGGTQGDYLATDATIIWDASNTSNYHNNVIGIGRDDNQELLQKQSHSFDDTARVYVGTLQATNVANTGSFSADISYVLMGDNGGSMHRTAAADAEVPGTCGLYSRLEREWKVTKSNFADNFSIDAKLSPTGNPGSVNTAHLRLLVDDDGDFSNGGTTCYFNGDGTGIVITYSNPVITISNISNTHLANNTTSFITIGSVNVATPLPVELVHFEAECINNEAHIQWTTQSEINNDYYVLEKSGNGDDFKELTRINGFGTTTDIQQYAFVDTDVEGLSYYRLQQVDVNGSTNYSDVITNNCDQLENSWIYPNPTRNHFTINGIEEVKGKLEVVVYNYLGEIVIHKTYQNVNQLMQSQINIQQLKSGIYLVSLRQQSESKNFRLIKKD